MTGPETDSRRTENGRARAEAVPLWRRWFRPATLGERGEKAAERFLRRQGFRVIARRERDLLGELDLVVSDGKLIAFVEVKTRSSLAGGDPLEAVDAEKQRRLTRAALGYLTRHGLTRYPARFDVVSVFWPEDAKRAQIEHIVNAFEAVGNLQMFN